MLLCCFHVLPTVFQSQFDEDSCIGPTQSIRIFDLNNTQKKTGIQPMKATPHILPLYFHRIPDSDSDSDSDVLFVLYSFPKETHLQKKPDVPKILLWLLALNQFLLHSEFTTGKTSGPILLHNHPISATECPVNIQWKQLMNSENPAMGKLKWETGER